MPGSSSQRRDDRLALSYVFRWEKEQNASSGQHNFCRTDPPGPYSTCDPIERNYVPPSQDAITTASNELEPYGDPDAGSPSLPKAPARDASMLPSTAANGDSAAKAKGTACSRASECESRYCVDGLCCERPCADVCSTCAAPGSEGTCSPTSIDVNCGTLSCGQAGDCRGYDLSQTQHNSTAPQSASV